jgi:hypothetical protein
MDNGTGSEDQLGRRRPTREEHPPSGQGEHRRAATIGIQLFPVLSLGSHMYLMSRLCLLITCSVVPMKGPGFTPICHNIIIIIIIIMFYGIKGYKWIERFWQTGLI